ncbi:GNAT family N-acetyltransferase [Stakelama marina]|uniref:GNAT family N-acetyltransferase n=1 Tax=Stakelama marina TaxID=2826939 RepID=A0A8T4II07_9SPHN|nr:GNAT family N-acetyltransferase [Stakelama marina]MBR0551836.1 GNAT family N-acetyltransferase [Stakelama marina]
MIETERLLLRVPDEGDFAALAAMWADPVVMADLGPVKDEVQSREAFARHAGYREQGLGFLVVVPRDGDTVAGFAGLKPGAENTPIEGEVEIGWMLATPWWGKGYAAEAARAVLDWCWRTRDADRIVAITAERNMRSRKLMDRLGMRHDPADRFDHPLFDAADGRRSTVIYSIGRPR